jgi:hypothetical protein
MLANMALSACAALAAYLLIEPVAPPADAGTR